MNFKILQMAAKPIAVLQLGLSVYLLLRGHNEPGGGFIGGLIAATAFILIGMSDNLEKAKRWMLLPPVSWIAIGLFVSLFSGLLAWTFEKPMMTGLWGGSIWLPAVSTVKLGTPLLFDIGVYFVVIGIATTIVFTLMESEEENG